MIPGSHASQTARLMLEYKGIDYRRVDLIPVIAKVLLRLLGFPGSTVPAVKIDGLRVQGTRDISRMLERIKPEPALFPQDPDVREKVEEAERWGDEVLQPVPRRLVWWCLKRDQAPMADFAEGTRLGIPLGLALKTAAPVAAASARFNGATDEAVRAGLARLPALLDRVDRWIEEEVLGGEAPNAADFQIATSLRLLLCFDDLRPFIVRRPAWGLAMRLQPELSGNVSSSFPEEWLRPLADSVSST